MHITASYTCGWFNFIGNMAGDASFAYSFAGLLNAGLVICGSTPFTTHVMVGTSIMTLTIWSILNVFRVDHIGGLNILAAILHISAIFLIILVVIILPPQLSTPHDVFFRFQVAESAHTSDTYSGAIGLLFACFCFTGYESCGMQYILLQLISATTYLG